MKDDLPTAPFLFDEEPHTAAFVCTHVWNGDAPIRYVSHDRDGDWQFLCGAGNHDVPDALLIGLGHVVERDASLNELASMCTGHVAEREDVNAAWTIHDETVRGIREVIDEHGWWIGLIEESEDEPAFALGCRST